MKGLDKASCDRRYRDPRPTTVPGTVHLRGGGTRLLSLFLPLPAHSGRSRELNHIQPGSRCTGVMGCIGPPAL